LGYPDQAWRTSQNTLALARELLHPFSLVFGQFQVATFHQFRRDVSETRKLAEALQGLAVEHGFAQHLASALVLQGWGLAERGHGEEGLAQIRQGLADPGAIPPFWRVYFLALLAEACGRAGKAEQGLTALAEALEAVADKGIGYYEPELHRLKGELLLARYPGNAEQAEACFRQAGTIARRQSAKSLELRAAVSLNRLLQSHGKPEEARPLLAEIYGWFTEGFDTADLRVAKALLEGLSRG
jgi:predicted ATPase